MHCSRWDGTRPYNDVSGVTERLEAVAAHSLIHDTRPAVQMSHACALDVKLFRLVEIDQTPTGFARVGLDDYDLNTGDAKVAPPPSFHLFMVREASAEVDCLADVDLNDSVAGSSI